MAALAILLVLVVCSRIMKTHSRRQLAALSSKTAYNIAMYSEDPVNCIENIAAFVNKHKCPVNVQHCHTARPLKLEGKKKQISGKTKSQCRSSGSGNERRGHGVLRAEGTVHFGYRNTQALQAFLHH